MFSLNPNLICIYIATAMVLPVGIYVYMANSRRIANKVFLQISVALLIWLLVIGNTFISRDPESALFWFRLTNFSSLFVLLSIYYMRVSIVYQDNGILKIIRRTYPFTLLTLAVAIMTLTPFFSDSMQIFEGLAVPQPAYGKGMPIFGAFAVISGVTIFVMTILDIKKAEGLQRIELQYVALGSAVGWSVGLAMTTGVQVFSPGSDAIIYAPLAALSLHLTIAYGVATKRLMGVADVLRRTFAYGLLLIYLILVYSGVAWLVHSIIPTRLASFSDLPYIIASLAVIASVAPVGNFFRKFTQLLFLRIETMDGHKALRQLNNFVRSVKTIPQLLENFATFLGETLGTDRVVILLPRGDSFIQSYPKTQLANVNVILTHKDPLITYLKSTTEPISQEVLQRQGNEEAAISLASELSQLNASMATAVRTKEDLLAILLLGPRLSGQIYSLNEQNLLHTLANTFGLAIENSAYLTEVENAKVYNDILLENLVSGVIATDANGVTTVCNREAARLLEISTADVVGKPLMYLPTQLAVLVQETLDLCLLSDTTQINLQSKSGAVVPIRISRTVIRGHSGQRVGSLLVFDDESDIRQLELKLRRSDRLARLGTLSATMAHKIRVPLLIIKNLLEKLPENFDNEGFRNKCFKTVVSEVTSIDSSVRSLLQFAKPTSPDSKPVSIHDTIERALESIANELKEKNTVILKNYTKNSDYIDGSAVLLRQVFTSYFLHTLEEMRSGGTVTITTKIDKQVIHNKASETNNLPEACFVVALHDTSRRIQDSAESRAQALIVEAADSEQDLGLEIAKDILADHGGSLEIELGKKSGRTIYFLFPLPTKERSARSLEP